MSSYKDAVVGGLVFTKLSSIYLNMTRIFVTCPHLVAILLCLIMSMAYLI